MAINKKIVEITRNLRSLQTPEENELWEKLRNRKLNGLKFLRQHPIVYGNKGYIPLFFVADFYCAEKKLVIELDGKIHEFQKDYDENRDSILRELELFVLRIRNEELSNINFALKKITEFSTHPPSPSLQSREGVSERSEDGGELAILILAAGSSSRMGQSKQLLILNGKPLLRKVTEEALTIEQSKVIVVLGANSAEHEKVIHDLPINIIVNEQWQKGMASSLKAGVKFIENTISSIQAVIVLVCDQPFLTSAHLKKLVDHFYSCDKSIIASSYSNTLGVPCLFGKNYFSELRNLRDDQGAKKLIHLFKDDVESVDFPKGEIDLDTMEDYKKLER